MVCVGYPQNPVMLHEAIMGSSLELCSFRNGPQQTAKVMQEKLGIPIVSLEHTLPTSVLKPEWLAEIKQMSGDVDVFISEFSRDEWGIESINPEVVHHGVDSKLFRSLKIEKQP